jgi:hypothetical protein
MPTDTDDLDFMKAMKSMFDMDEDAVEELIERLEADEVTELSDALANNDKARAEEIVASAETSPVNPLFRGSNLEVPQQKKRVQRVGNDYQYKYGDDVQVEVTDPAGKVSHVDGTVYLPNGPANTVGVKIQGKSRMVKRNKLNRLAENVLGMTNMPDLSRMQQLAGLQPAGADVAPMEITVQDSDAEGVTADPCAAAQQAMAALDTVEAMLPNIRLADIKQIRQRIVNLQTQMNEGVAPLRARKKM